MVSDWCLASMSRTACSGSRESSEVPLTLMMTGMMDGAGRRWDGSKVWPLRCSVGGDDCGGKVQQKGMRREEGSRQVMPCFIERGTVAVRARNAQQMQQHAVPTLCLLPPHAGAPRKTLSCSSTRNRESKAGQIHATALCTAIPALSTPESMHLVLSPARKVAKAAATCLALLGPRVGRSTSANLVAAYGRRRWLCCRLGPKVLANRRGRGHEIICTRLCC